MFFIMLVQLYTLGMVLTVAAVVSVMKEGDHCVTPNKEKSTCVPLVKCGVILAALTSGDPNQFQFYKKSECGPETGLVCCGSLGYQNKTPTTTPIPLSELPIVSLSDLSDESVCGLESVTYRINGGTIAEFKEFPWLAALEYNSTFTNQNAGIRCGGSLINDRFVLTAAHCIVHVEFVIIKVWLGVTNTSSGGNCLNQNSELKCVNSTQKVNVLSAHPSPGYDGLNGLHDIGLLKLDHKIMFTDYIRPICVPFLTLARLGSYMTVAGWGTTEHSGRSEIKLKVEVPVQNNSICDKFLKIYDRKLEPSVQLCVGGERGKDTCQGDSGGPLMMDFLNENRQIQWYLEAVVSYGVGCGIEGRPGVYTRVQPYIRWIRNLIEKPKNPEQGDACVTPNGKDATCEPLNTCKEVFEMVYSKNRTTEDSANKFYCSNANGVLLVCCETPGAVIVPNFETKTLPSNTTCGVVKEEFRIGDGEISDYSSFPWTVGIEQKHVENGESVGIQCVGSLINNRYILTHAICLIDEHVIPFMVWLGDWNNSTNIDCLKPKFECADQVQKIAIKEMIPHIFFSHTGFQNNIGLILVENDIQFTDYVLPVCLPSLHLPPVGPGKHMVLNIWNKTSDGNLLFDAAGATDILLVTNKYMNSSTDLLFTESKSFCEYEIGTLVRPSYVNNSTERTQWYLEGIQSYCTLRGKYIVYTRVSSYMEWIVNIIAEN